MGLHIGFKSCSRAPTADPPLPAPDPSRFTIKRVLEVGHALVVRVNYPDCTNYEGNKIMVFACMTEERLRSLAQLDPHFQPGFSPIARFEPTERGWELAVQCAENLQ